MRQKTDILEEVPIYHKTRSAMYLFLTPHQREVQRTFGFWIDDEKNPCYVDFFSLSASHLNPNLVRCRLPFWVHLGDAPKHKHPGSGSYLPQDQKCDAPVLNSPPEVQRTFGFWIDDEKCPFGGDFFSLSASHLNPTQPYKFVNW